ncbi:hypothetical protein CesoFtcFv8_011534 [Champsocephalus esox]|uniref:Uncharacterized protein n=2 Tax=Champsocephalus TaxID=52236 RepID=A0AAN8DN13_CHAGU|nr:hypothetical protein CesoFtcFv8_011534 [Champsocephalus esox]KAK5923913.1 hypothetical protein CgunFtcFv8_000839 [Champsocephalus gunnari]
MERREVCFMLLCDQCPLPYPLPLWPHVCDCQTLPPSRPAATLIELRNNEANSHADSTAPNGIPKDTLYL